jgi:hypothetical protein
MLARVLRGGRGTPRPSKPALTAPGPPMPPTPTPTYERLRETIAKRMRMSHS